MKRSLWVILVAALFLAACASSRSSNEYGLGGAGTGNAPAAPPQEQYSDVMPAPTMGYSDLSKSGQVPEGGSGGSVTATTTERLVVQNADLSIVVPDPKAKMKSVAKMAQDMGGFVVSSNLYQSYAPNGNPVPQADLVIRVPAMKLDEALDTIKKDALDVQSENRSGQDVTAEYVDLQSRLKANQDALDQLEKIMETNTTPEQVLNVFNQMTYYREQIELIKGQMKYYEEAAALSAITIHLVAEETIQPLEIGGWEPQGVARDAIQNLIYFWQGFVDFLINFFLYVLPVLITIAIPFYVLFLILRWLIRKMRKPKAETKTEAK